MDRRQIGMAQLVVIRAPGIIRSSGLGSCIGIALYDPFVKVGGMAHTMLPVHRPGREDNKAKYVDTAIEAMLMEIKTMGGSAHNVIAKMAGGGQMFPDSEKDPSLYIGSKNIEATKKYLVQFDIPLIAQHVGGHLGRTLEFDLEDGSLHIKTLKNETKI